MRLIDADALGIKEAEKEAYNEFVEHSKKYGNTSSQRHFYLKGRSDGLIDASGIIKFAPTIDAIPVVHSWWEVIEHNNSLIPCVGYKCHNCGSKYARLDTEKKEYNYCPDCGACMDRRREDGDA